MVEPICVHFTFMLNSEIGRANAIIQTAAALRARVGDSRARRFVGDGRYPWGPDRRATLADTQRFDDVVLLRYSLSPRFRLD